MANIRNRNGKWQVQVRRLGHASKVRSFLSKSDAQRWARQMEAELDRAYTSGDTKGLRGLAVSDILTRYRDTVTIRKRGAKSESKRIDVFLRQIWTKLPLSHVTPAIFSQYRDRRSKLVSPGTVIRLSADHLQVCVGSLEEWKLFNSNLDVIDDAFEYLVNKSSKGEKGQYFTPRWVIDMCVKMLNPRENETVIDTACGSAGFTVHAMFHVWRQIIREMGLPDSHLFTMDKKPMRCED